MRAQPLFAGARRAAKETRHVNWSRPCIETIGTGGLLGVVGCLLLLAAAPQAQAASPQGGTADSVTVPVTLDHNRMLVQAEVQRRDGTWRTALLWIDTGNPNMMLSEAFARDLGIDLSGARTAGTTVIEVPPPTGVRIGGMPLSFDSVRVNVHLDPQWIFGTMHIDANLPSKVLRRYQVVFDYPRRRLTLAQPGTQRPRGERATASVNPTTGIVQIDAVIGGDTLSLALDNGASYSFVSSGVVSRIAERNPGWPRTIGAVGCANIWGQWPEEATWPIVRVSEMRWGPVRLADVGVVGLPDFFGNGVSLGDWYSRKAARRVEGFLGPNALKSFRIEIDYANSAVYFERGAADDAHDLDIVGLTLQPQTNGGYRVIGVAAKDGHPSVVGVEPGDVLLEIGGLLVTGASMGTVVDALRGSPGDTRALVLERNGTRVNVTATVRRFL